VEDAFDVIAEQSECVKTALWIGDCFIFTTSLNRLSYYVGGELVTVAHLDRPLYLLGFIPKDNRIYLCDKDHNIVSYRLLQAILEYQTAVMRRDFDAADHVLKNIPESQFTRVAHFLEKQGFKKQALAVSRDPEHRFDLALAMGELKIAKELAQQADSEEKWKQLATSATLKSDMQLAGECLGKAHDYGGLLLLASCSGNEKMMGDLSADSYASGQHNVSFLSSLLLGDVERCVNILVETERIPEAAFFAQCYCPSEVPRLVSLWREKSGASLTGIGKKKVGESLADPVKYENLFPGFAAALEMEQKRDALLRGNVSASKHLPPNYERNIRDELKAAPVNGHGPTGTPVRVEVGRGGPPGGQPLPSSSPMLMRVSPAYTPATVEPGGSGRGAEPVQPKAPPLAADPPAGAGARPVISASSSSSLSEDEEEDDDDDDEEEEEVADEDEYVSPSAGDDFDDPPAPSVQPKVQAKKE